MWSKTKRDTLLLVAVVFWILFVLGGYYYYHKPINLQMLAAPFRAFVDILFALLFAGLCGGIGRRILKAETIPPLERAALQFGLGIGVISLVWFALGLLGLYHFIVSLLLLIAGWILLRREAVGWYASLRQVQESWRASGTLEKVLAVLIAILMVYQLFVALAPPVKWDALAYHLQLPRQYIAAGRLVFVPENPYWGHPQLVEMVYTFAMTFHRPETAAVLGWSTGVIFLLGLLSFTNSQLARLQNGLVGSTAGWVAVTAVCAGLTFRSLLGWSYTDLFGALFGLGALIALFEWLDGVGSTWFLWSALFSGLALGTKWTSGVLFLAVMAAGLIYGKRNALSLRSWVLGGCIAFLMVVPWLVKNLVVTGSPVYPYLIPTVWVDAARMASANPPDEAVDWVMHLLLPFTSTWAGIDSAAGFSADLGPLLLLFALPGLLRYWRQPRVKILFLLLAVCGFAMGIASLRLTHLIQTRLYYAALPTIAVLCGWGWEWLQRQVLQGVRLRRILSAVLLLVMGLTLWNDTYTLGRTSPAAVSLGTQTRQQYLEGSLGYSILAMQKIEALPPASRILMLWEPRGLYAPLNAQADLWIDRWRTDCREVGSASAILARWKSQGFTHVLIYQPGVSLIQPQPGETPSKEWVTLQDLLALLPAPESVGDIYRLYPLK